MSSKEKRFLAPAHFQVSPKKDKKKTQALDGRDVKLLPPTEYKLGSKTRHVDRPRNQEAESFRERISELEVAVKQLELEKKHLQSQLEIAKDTELELQEENRRNKLLLQRSRVDDAVDLRRLAETEEENLTLKAEARKQVALSSKLKNDIHNIRTHYETEIEIYENRLQKQTAALKQLKLELNEKEENYAKNSAILEQRAKKCSHIVRELNAELQKAREKNESDRQQFENILGDNEAQKYTELQRLQQELHWCEQTHSKEITKLKEHLESRELSLINVINDMSDKDNQIATLMNECKELQLKFQDELERNKEKFHEREEACKQDVVELQADLEKCKASVNELQSTLKDKQKELESQNLISEQLKAYIGDNLPNTKIENLQRENEDLNSHVTGLMQENEHLKTTVELLNVRLSSSKELLAIQEQELEKSQGQTFGEPKQSVDGLLKRWRSKVFALLVQLKSEKLCQQRKEQQERTEIKELRNSLEDLKQQYAILEHSLVDRTAELKIEVNKLESLERELQASHADNEKLRAKLVNSMNAIKGIYTVAQDVELVQNTIESKMKDAFSVLSVCSQRTAFAVSRIQFLQGLFARREAKWNRELLEWKQERGKDSHSDKLNEPVCDDLTNQQLFMEVERLTKERDLLASEAKRDAEMVGSTVAAVTASYEEKLATTVQHIAQLESELKDERERSNGFKERLNMAEEELKEASETVESLKSDLARHETTAEKLVATAISEEQAKFTEQFATIEKQLNEIRKEHTKAVVALRQAERQVAREKEKAADEYQSQQMEYTQRIGKLKAQLQSVEKERNMLMATVRQEGLKLPRRHPTPNHWPSLDFESITDADKENRMENEVISKEVLSINKVSSSQSKAQTLDVAEALKDLESLSIAVLSVGNDD